MTLTFSTSDSIDWAATGIEQIKNNVINIVRTRLGEVPYMLGLGINPNYIDRPAVNDRAVMVADIRAQLRAWESEAQLTNLIITPDGSGDYKIEMEVML